MWKKLFYLVALCCIGLGSSAANLPPEEETKPDGKRKCCSGVTPGTNCCVAYQFTFGHSANDPLIPNGSVSVYALRPSVNLFSPINLYFNHPLFMQIMKAEKDGDTFKLQLQGENREAEVYVFKPGESIGYPGEDFRNKLSKTVVMLNADKQPTAENPVYYRLQNKDGSSALYSASTRKVIYFETSTKRQVTASSKDVQLDIIYGNDGSIRQINSGIDGLADVVVTVVEKGYILGYEIRLYAPDQVGAKNDEGIYTFTGSPYTTYKIFNPNHPTVSYDTYINPDTGEEIVTEKVSPPICTTAIFTKNVNGTDYITTYVYNDVVDDWTMNSSDLKTVTREKSWNSSKSEYTELMQVKNGTGVVVYQETTKNIKFPFGSMIEEKTIGTGDNAPKTWYTYHTDSSQNGSYGKLASERHSSGMWKKYFYDGQGRTTMIVSPFKNQSFNATQSDAKVEYFIYSPVDPKDVPYVGDPRPRVEETKIGGITVKKEYFAYFTESNGEYVEVHERCQNETAEYGNASNIRTETRYYASNADQASAGRLKSIRKPDGKLDTYTYEYGNFTTNTNPGNSTFTATENGYALKTSVIHGIWENSNGVANQSTKDEYISDQYGNQVMTKTYVCTNDSSPTYELFFWSFATYNPEHKVLNTYNSRNEETNSTWNCCNKESYIDQYGIQYSYIYNDLQQLIQETKIGVDNISSQTTSYSYDANGNLLFKMVQGSTNSVSEVYEFDVAGRLTKFVNTIGLAFSYQYTAGDNSGSIPRGETITTIKPGGTTEIEQLFCDGTTESITGSSVIAKYFDRGYDNRGNQWCEVQYGNKNSSRYEKITTDLAGRKIMTEVSSFNGSKQITQFFYNGKNQRSKVTRSGLPNIIYTYDSWGNIVQSGLDENENGILDPISKEQISIYSNSFAKESDTWWFIQTEGTYHKDNADMIALNNVQKKRVNNFSKGIMFELHNYDNCNNLTVQTYSIDRESKIFTINIIKPESVIPYQEVWKNGLKISSRNVSGQTFFYEYDDLGRLIKETDPRIGSTNTIYFTTPGKNGLIKNVTDPAGNVVSYEYDTNSGFLLWIKNSNEKFTKYSYNSRGQITQISGDVPQPIVLEYNELGEQTSLWSFRTNEANMLSGNIWDHALGDQTQWTYDVSSGVVTHLTDSTGKSITYEYDSNNRVTRRIRARLVDTVPLYTDYSYNQRGKLHSVNYSDDTPSIVYEYDRLGRIKTVQDGVGIRAFSYTDNYKLHAENISGIYNKNIVRAYTTSGKKGRAAGLYIDDTEIYTYGYDELGRINQVNSISFQRLLNSNLINSIQRTNGVNTLFSYEENRNVLTCVANGELSVFAYATDTIGRKTSVQKSGTAFSSPEQIIYSYTDRNELSSAISNINLNYNYSFSYDPIGNRQKSTTAGNEIIYSSNSLNQYTAIGNENITYDNDGNMLEYNGWVTKWDGENRLIEMNRGEQKICFAYDYKNRRVEKKVFDSNTLIKHIRFVYDDYKLVEELDATNDNTVLRKYVWQPRSIGLDVPLIMSDMASNSEFFYTTDAGKNISDITDANGNMVAHYEYSPYGVLTKMEGALANANPFRFSSEYYDSETGLVYYIYRYYSPQLGRWLSKDPSGINGGYNLNQYVNNDPINNFDVLGLHCQPCHEAYEACTESAGNALRACLKKVGEEALALAELLLETAVSELKAMEQAAAESRDYSYQQCENMHGNAWYDRVGKLTCKAGVWTAYLTAMSAATTAYIAAVGAIAGIVSAFEAGQTVGCTMVYAYDMVQCDKALQECLKDYGYDENGCPCNQ